MFFGKNKAPEGTLLRFEFMPSNGQPRNEKKNTTLRQLPLFSSTRDYCVAVLSERKTNIEETRILHPKVSTSLNFLIFKSIVYKPNDLFGDNVSEMFIYFPVRVCCTFPTTSQISEPK